MNETAQGSWQIFNELLESTPRGNFGNFALYFDMLEISPSILGDYRYNKANDEISRYSSKEVEVRALIEGQFIAKRVHAEDLGFVIGKFLFFSLPFLLFSFGVSYLVHSFILHSQDLPHE